MDWDVEKVKDQIAHCGRYGAKRVMEAVYRNNIKVFQHWGYRLPEGRLVGLGDRNALPVGTKVYARAFDVNDVPVQAKSTKTGCVNADCVDVAKALLDAGYRPAILNLASRRRPDGGYDKGMGAQEETLCRLSMLSQLLYQYYDPKYKCVQEAEVPHRFNAYPLDVDFGGIYSPGVVFFRRNQRDGCAFREAPFACGEITVAALGFREPNNYCNEERQYLAPDGGFTPQGDAIQLNKIRTIYRLALKSGHDSVVLGAFGCGVNKLPSGAFADLFGRVIDEPEFNGKLCAVVFAILEGCASVCRPIEDQGRFAPFYETFGRWGMIQDMI